MIFNWYLADTDITDIYLADTDTNMAGTDIQFADTDISVSANYISKPIYKSIYMLRFWWVLFNSLSLATSLMVI